MARLVTNQSFFEPYKVNLSEKIILLIPSKLIGLPTRS